MHLNCTFMNLKRKQQRPQCATFGPGRQASVFNYLPPAPPPAVYDLALSILRETSDGDELSAGQLRLVAAGLNGFLGAQAIARLEQLHEQVQTGRRGRAPGDGDVNPPRA